MSKMTLRKAVAITNKVYDIGLNMRTVVAAIKVRYPYIYGDV